MSLKSLLWQLLPRRRTSEVEARQAIINAGVSPDNLLWRVTDEGTFVFGRKHHDDQSLSCEQIDALTNWAHRNRIRLGFIGWEEPAS